MAIDLERDLLRRLAEGAGDIVVVVHTDSADAAHAVQHAAAALGALRHPHEPTDAWPNAARATTVLGRPALVADFKDRVDEPGLSGLAVGVLTAALVGAGIDALLALAPEPADEQAAPAGDEDLHAALDDDAYDGADEDQELMPSAAAKLLIGFPWPSDVLPLPEALAPVSCTAFVPRDAATVEAELVARLTADGRLVGQGKIHEPDGGSILLAVHRQVDWSVVLRQEGPGTRLSVANIGLAALQAADRCELLHAAEWTVQPS